MYRINLVDELERLNSLLYCPYGGNYYFIRVKYGPLKEYGLSTSAEKRDSLISELIDIKYILINNILLLSRV